MMTQVSAMIRFSNGKLCSLQIQLFGSGPRPQGSGLARPQEPSLRWDPMRDYILTSHGDDDAVFPFFHGCSFCNYYENAVLL